MSIRDVEPPEGEPTFVFTDIEGSSALWEAVPEAMRRSLRIHDALMHAACAAQQGYAVKSEGDAFMIAFAEPRQAMGFAHLVQQTLAKMTWPAELEAAQLARGMHGCLGLRVRIGIHHGKAELRTNELSGRADYFGGAVNVAARLSDMAHGAQTIISEASLKKSGSPEQAMVTCLGPTAVRGMKQKIVVHQMVSAAWWPIEFPPLRLGKIVTHDAEGKPVERMDLNSEMEGVAYQLLARAQIERLSGRLDAARFELRALQAVADWLNDHNLVVDCLLEQASADFNSGRHEEGLALIRDALKITAELDDTAKHCRALLSESDSLRVLGRFDEARRSADSALVLSWRTKDVRVTARARGSLAELDRMEGALEQAESGMRAALEVLREQGDQNVARSLTSNLGMLLVERGDEESVSVLTKLVDEYEALHMAMSAAAARANLSLYYLDRNEREAFERLNHQASAVFKKASHSDHLAALKLNSAYFELQAGDVAAAWSDLWSAGESFPIDFVQGLDLEGGVLHAWLAFLRGERAKVQEGLKQLWQEAELDESLLGPMVVQLVKLMTAIVGEDDQAAAAIISKNEAPATVTFRVLWRVMVDYAKQD